jgi:hypothetical protein
MDGVNRPAARRTVTGPIHSVPIVQHGRPASGRRTPAASMVGSAYRTANRNIGGTADGFRCRQEEDPY